MKDKLPNHQSKAKRLPGRNGTENHGHDQSHRLRSSSAAAGRACTPSLPTSAPFGKRLLLGLAFPCSHLRASSPSQDCAEAVPTPQARARLSRAPATCPPVGWRRGSTRPAAWSPAVTGARATIHALLSRAAPVNLGHRRRMTQVRAPPVQGGGHLGATGGRPAPVGDLGATGACG